MGDWSVHVNGVFVICVTEHKVDNKICIYPKNTKFGINAITVTINHLAQLFIQKNVKFSTLDKLFFACFLYLSST